MLKSFVKKTWLWKILLQSKLYYRLKYPAQFKKYQEEFSFYKEFLQSHPYKNELIFDVGANMGRKSFIFLKLAKKVIAFEPSERLFLFLKKRFKQENILLFNCALGSSVSTLDFFIIEGNEAYNSLNRKHIESTAKQRGVVTKNNVKPIKVKVDILENFIQEYGIPKYIKIDVEGHECDVIKGLITPVPLLSFEANLPEFRLETINAIRYLQTLSNNKYSFNFATDFSWISKDFLCANEAVKFLTNTSLPYLEIYVKMRK